MKMIIHCGHHKCGSALFGKVLRKICKHLNLRCRGTKGPEKKGIYSSCDIAIFANSTVDFTRISKPYTGTHMIRDPRDVIVSGYLYHARCQEEWCTNLPDETRTPVEFPQIPYSQYRRTENWKRQYLHSLNGSSYQDNINNRDMEEGLLFEMHNYGRWTIESMLEWNYGNPHIMELKFEEVMGDFMGSFEKVFSHYEFPPALAHDLLDLIASENLNNLSDKDIRENPHIHSRRTSKWREYFSSRHKAQFKKMFGDALIKLGYEGDNNW